jgi:hypothetical protein
MTDAGFVIAGWAMTGGVLAAYTIHLTVRLRRARRSLPESNAAPSR